MHSEKGVEKFLKGDHQLTVLVGFEESLWGKSKQIAETQEGKLDHGKLYGKIQYNLIGDEASRILQELNRIL